MCPLFFYILFKPPQPLPNRADNNPKGRGDCGMAITENRNQPLGEVFGYRINDSMIGRNLDWVLTRSAPP